MSADTDRARRAQILDDVKPDTGRRARTGIAEAVYGPGKSPAQCAEAVEQLLAGEESPVLLTRATRIQTDAVTARCRNGNVQRVGTDEHGDETFIVTWATQPPRVAEVIIATGGTADLPVAREAQLTLEAYGYRPRLLADVGVAGVHRLLDRVELLRRCDALIVVAGMEGALASVATGLTRAPVIAVPTSTGYGAGLGGVTALLAMLASCSPGISVVGIDNGFGAACATMRILGGSDREPA